MLAAEFYPQFSSGSYVHFNTLYHWKFDVWWRHCQCHSQLGQTLDPLTRTGVTRRQFGSLPWGLMNAGTKSRDDRRHTGFLHHSTWRLFNVYWAPRHQYLTSIMTFLCYQRWVSNIDWMLLNKQSLNNTCHWGRVTHICIASTANHWFR